MEILAPLQTIGDTVYRKICPLYSFSHRNRVYIAGSAVPFTVAGFSFLITAAHVCFDHNLNPVPLFTWGSETPRALIRERIIWESKPSLQPDMDIALIRLSPEDEIELKKCYDFCHPAITSNIKPKTPGIHYMIAGYPEIRNRVKPGTSDLPSLATFLVTGNIQTLSSLQIKNKNDERHFALSFKNEKIVTSDGEIFRIPKPHGMSGGAIWSLNINRQTKMASTPQLVGIGIEYIKNESLFIGTKIECAIPLAHDLLSIISGKIPSDVIDPKSQKYPKNGPT